MKTKISGLYWRGLTAAALVLALTGLSSFAQLPGPSAAPLGLSAPIQPAPGKTVALASGGSVAAPTKIAGDIRDIRGPIHIPPPLRWPWWLAGSAGLAALAYGIWYWRRRRGQVAALLLYQVALARLEEARGLMRPENAREFSILVSEIVRQFIEVRFQVRAARRTTEEFLRDLLAPSDALLADHRGSLADFLRHCDLAKFARWVLSIDEMTTMLQSAHNFVLQSGPTPPPPTAVTVKTPGDALHTAVVPTPPRPVLNRTFL